MAVCMGIEPIPPVRQTGILATRPTDHNKLNIMFLFLKSSDFLNGVADRFCPYSPSATNLYATITSQPP